ncbi:hypothetical protein ACJMK2_009884 [Sinanodonta woodiana]|uniref:CUB domain-containing protein n=1 Tax=Sinanodonta woodiana TaxID=1069815 RepID=A0ABD3VEV9_SINWO
MKTIVPTLIVWVWLLANVGKGAKFTHSNLLTISPPPMTADYIDPKCWNFTYGNWENMEFYSPNYPNHYLNDVECVTYLEAPPGFNIELVFMEKFHIEHSDGCKYDFVEFRDGPFGYSKPLARYCGNAFPEVIQTESRFLWARFKTDKLLQYEGFKAVYEYKIDGDYSPVQKEVCRVYLDKPAPDGILSSKDVPLVDPDQPDYPHAEPIDCTWEIHVDKGSKVRISDLSLEFSKANECDLNMVEIYDGTTAESRREAVYCKGSPVDEFVSNTNRVFIRILGQRLAWKPTLKAVYTVFKEGPECNVQDFACDGKCISKSLVCNGRKNCPGGTDEENCNIFTEAASGSSDSMPMHIIILAAVGGVLLTSVVIGVCITCRYKRLERRKREEMLRQQEQQKKNTLEMAVLNSGNSKNVYAQAQKSGQGYYHSLPRPSGQATLMQHRNSFSKPPSEGDYGDHLSDSSTYKKFLQLEHTMDDEAVRCPSPSPYGQGSVFTTIVEHHPCPPGMTQEHQYWGGYGHPAQHGDNLGSPTLAENLSKLAHYNTLHSQTSQNVPGGMTMEFKYDPSPNSYPSSKFRIKADGSYGWGDTPKFGKSLLYKNIDADAAPDITREIETPT